ncbi:DNA-binding response regulator, NarL/FixJ family, contains REC and HTH domains [Asanoa hainanensis]|uniref:DNA-binding response regulator, NarL/FixJ family, contains REC and HTH domains n=1 Tax=Asanoa hainanensis TaxID=560556 RepID=A0A239P2J4_9ACTN|nr:response regulator transcription factor [Asanoa hainanensis]SNT60559.1 DNA-binding response regulator, NarL/FixJ family, contains REC and HTH domains [Asanoa hainanensis]
MTVTVLLADDQELVRAGFAMILGARDDIEVVGEAGDGLEAVALAAETKPDVVLMDVRMPRLDGIEATRRIVDSGSPARVVMLTTFDLDEPVFAALRAGASGFLLKDIRPADLADAVRVVARGEALLAPTVTRRLLDRFATGLPARSGPDRRLEALTAREVEVLTLVARAMTNAEIAERLFLTQATVKTHISAILTKLDLRDRVQAAVLAYETGLVRPGA